VLNLAGIHSHQNGDFVRFDIPGPNFVFDPLRETRRFLLGVCKFPDGCYFAVNFTWGACFRKFGI
jgi:hypothetical protein